MRARQMRERGSFNPMYNSRFAPLLPLSIHRALSLMSSTPAPAPLLTLCLEGLAGGASTGADTSTTTPPPPPALAAWCPATGWLALEMAGGHVAVVDPDQPEVCVWMVCVRVRHTRGGAPSLLSNLSSSFFLCVVDLHHPPPARQPAAPSLPRLGAPRLRHQVADADRRYRRGQQPGRVDAPVAGRPPCLDRAGRNWRLLRVLRGLAGPSTTFRPSLGFWCAGRDTYQR